MTQRLQDKVVIVTGAGAGIGLGIVQSCVREGATVIMAEVNPAAEARTQALSAAGADVHFCLTDVSDPESIAQCVAFTAEKFGRIDGVVNNAGITLEGDFLEFDLERLERMWTTNLRSTYLMCQHVGRVMKAQGGGSIVNVSSNHAFSSTPDYEMYAATKAGIVAMSKSMAWSLGKYGIRVNTLCPGLTKTEAVEQVVTDKPHLEPLFGAMHADGKYATVGEIGDIAAFLLSSDSAALTGTDLIADHGLSASLCKVDDLK